MAKGTHTKPLKTLPLNSNMKTFTTVVFLAFLFYACIEKEPRSEKNNGSQKENFHLYLLMGQSNMAGRGKVEAIDTLTHPRVLMLDKQMQWVLAKDPLHYDKPIAGTGLGLTFGKILAEKNDSIKVGLIPCAKGGSSINQWFQDSLHQATNSYPYNEMIDKARKAMTEGTLKGILWHQGESDTGTEVDLEYYPEKFSRMLDSIWVDLAIDPLPVVMGEIGHFYYVKRPLARKLNNIFGQIARNSCTGLVKSDQLGHKGDTVHFNAASYRELGKRYADRLLEVQASCAADHHW